jgi:nitrate/TMAO reductase-like tetraheme cytochrome c subunit
MKLPKSYFNPISFYGSILAAFAVTLILFLLFLSLFFIDTGGYMGLIVYMILPIFLVIGLIMIPVGMYIKAKRERKTAREDSKWNVINLNDRSTRNAMIIFVIGSFIFLFLTAIGSYHAFHYTESNNFCGTLCHEVMHPEYTAYQNSSHAHVNCVECHVGEGADWYAKSKLSGMYQVYSVLTNKYTKPIETPLHNLRPARETCERCHWPDKFYSNKIVNNISYLTDEKNSEVNITLKMKTAAPHSASGLTEGIHWHINPNVKVEYIANSHSRSEIPWVRYINTETNDTIVYHDSWNTLEQNLIDSLEVREMDCMDCHNRPSHRYRSPADYIDDGLAIGVIPKELPKIKLISMDLLNKKFSTMDSSLNYIAISINSYYEKNYPELYSSKKELIDQAVTGIQEEFKTNAFPEMNVYHSSYSEHIGHQESAGCFRCHSSRHESSNGEQIRNDCNMCHTILAQSVDTISEITTINNALEFKHPVDIDEMWKEMACFECHSELY